MLIDNNINIMQGTGQISRVYQGQTVVWEPLPSGDTVIHYKSSTGRELSLYTGSTWYDDIVSNTYKNGLGTVTFSGKYEIRTFYRLFDYQQYVSYIEIPESIVEIDYGAFSDMGRGTPYGVEIVTHTSEAPMMDRREWYNSLARISSLTYPDDADYIPWYFPGFYAFGETTYPENWTIFGHLTSMQILPQVIKGGDYPPTNQFGWDGDYLGIINVDGDGYNTGNYYAFSRKIVNVPERAFQFSYNSTSYIFPDCTTTFGAYAFDGAYMSEMPRFRGAQVFGTNALNFGTAITIDLPSGVTQISPTFNTGAAQIKAYGAQPSLTMNVTANSAGTFYYNSNYDNAKWISRIPQGWTIRAVNPDLWPDLPYNSIYVRATSITLTLRLGLYDSTESWEDGYFYISGGSYTTNTEIAHIDHYEQEKTVTVGVQSGSDYIISYKGTAPGCYIYEVTGGDTLYVNQVGNLHFYADKSSVLMTIPRGDRRFHMNNEYVLGWED